MYTALVFSLMLFYTLVWVMGGAKILQIYNSGPSTILLVVLFFTSSLVFIKRFSIPKSFKYIYLYLAIIGIIISQTLFKGVIECCPESLERFIVRAAVIPFLLFYLFCQLSQDNKLYVTKQLGKWLLAIGVIGSILSIIQYVTLNELFYVFRGSDGALAGYMGGGRVYGLASKPYLWGLFLMFSIFISFSYRTRMHFIVFYMLIILFVTSLLLTQARSVIIAFAFTLLIMPVISISSRKRWNRLIPLLVSLAVVLPIAIPLFFVVLVNTYGIETLGPLSGVLSSTSVSHRLYLVDIISSYMAKHPLFFAGYGGFPSFSFTSDIKYLSEIRPDSESIGRGVGAHNFFWGLIIDLGIIMFSVLMMYLVSVLSFFFKKNGNHDPKIYYGYAFLAIVFSGIGQNNEETSIIWSVFFFYLVFKNIENNSSMTFKSKVRELV